MNTSLHEELEKVFKGLPKYCKKGKSYRFNCQNFPIHLFKENFDNIVNTKAHGYKEDLDDANSNFLFSDPMNKSARTCLTCNLKFDSREDQILHFKSDFHIFNLKRVLLGKDPLDEPSFNNSKVLEESTCEEKKKEESSGESSSEESDDSSLDENFAKLEYISDRSKVKKISSPKYGPMVEFFDNSLLDYKVITSFGFFQSDALIKKKEWSLENPWNLLEQQIKYNLKFPLCCVLLLRSGRFAGAILDDSIVSPHDGGSKLLIHKVLRKYTVRAKAGGSQSSHDNKGRKANSMGAQLRRHGEKSLRDEVQNLLKLWSGSINSCGQIYISAPKSMQNIIFDESLDLFSKNDARIIRVPFQITKPSLEEILTVHYRCRGIFMAKNIQNFDAGSVEFNEEGKKTEEISVVKSVELSGKDFTSNRASLQENFDQLIINPISKSIYDICSQQNESSAIKKITELENNHEIDQPLDFYLNLPHSIEDLMTPLHISSMEGKSQLVMFLLRKGSDPTKLDVRGRPAYFIAKNKETRDSFRRYRGEVEENLYDWNAAGIPTALNDEIEKAQREKEKEKKKRAQQRKKEQKKKSELEKKMALEKFENDKKQKEAEDRKKIEFEKNQAELCSVCRKPMYGMIPLDVLGQRCCSSHCVVTLRRELAAEAALKRLG